MVIRPGLVTTVPLVLLLHLILPSAVLSTRVLDLTPVTIDAHLSAAAAKPLLLEFYAPWCRHCISFAPAYASVARTLADTAVVARVDGSRHKVLSLRFRVRAFPTFFLVSDGRVYDFSGPRSHDALVAFVSDHAAATPHNYFFGPLGPYWSLVGAGFRSLDALYSKILDADLSPAQVAAAAAVAISITLLAFVAVIYIVTKPPVPKTRPVAPQPQRPHVD